MTHWHIELEFTEMEKSMKVSSDVAKLICCSDGNILCIAFQNLNALFSYE